MGLSNSKVVKEKKEIVEKTSLPSSPISTPHSAKKFEIDPRSPSTNISRTPVEVSHCKDIFATSRIYMKCLFLA